MPVVRNFCSVFVYFKSDVTISMRCPSFFKLISVHKNLRKHYSAIFLLYSARKLKIKRIEYYYTLFVKKIKEDFIMSKFRYSVGPWNVHEGADAYGPATRETIDLEEKIKTFAEMGFDAIQLYQRRTFSCFLLVTHVLYLNMHSIK